MSNHAEAVRVVVRVRPLAPKEEQDGHVMVATCSEEGAEITVQNPRADEREPPKRFTFDAAFGPRATQRHIYDVCAAPLIESVLQGYNGTIFAYGQTGAGKTHTMEGFPDPPEERGIIPNAFQHIFDEVALADTDTKQYLVRASYLEIYNENIRDLLSKDPTRHLDLRETADSGVYVKDLTSYVVKNASEIHHVMTQGKKNRSVASTNMNLHSSRSHAIFTIVVECADSDDRGDHIRVGKLNLVDLAGSERQSKTGATGDRLKEATKINLSLSALGNVISALVDGRSQHIPYRDSKLTRLLQDSLGGNTKTVMCANCGPADYNYDETLSTLRYANRAKNIRNKPRINEDPKDAMIREFQEEIERLKAQLAGAGDGGPGGITVDVNGQPVADGRGGGEVVERVVEKEVVKEVQVGVAEEEVKAMQEAAESEKKTIMRRAAEDMRELLDQQAKTEEERQALKERLESEAEARRATEEQTSALKERLASMQEKLIQGGQIMDKAMKQEAMLRKAQQDLEEQQQREMQMQRELQSKAEMNLQMEDQYTSLQEEVEVKTRKLKKLWAKLQEADREVSDLQEEFQTEREDMLDTIRQLSRQVKLKEAIIANFVPPDEVLRIERRAEWSDDTDNWIIHKAEHAGNQVHLRRPISSSSLRRPETEFARQRKQFDNSPRYKYDNIINMEMDMPERTTEDYKGPGMVSRVQPVLQMSLDDGDDDEIAMNAVDTGPTNPYLQYPRDESAVGAGDGPSQQQHSGRESSAGRRDRGDQQRSRSKKAKSRPKTAGRKGRSNNTGGGSGGGGGSNNNMGADMGMGASTAMLDEYELKMAEERQSIAEAEEEMYPSRRGLVGK